MKAMAAMMTGLALAACGGEAARPAVGIAPTRPAPMATTGLERILGQDAAGLTRAFGAPAADMREGSARKLQFQGPICVLDAYLYPKDGREPVVTYVDARQPDGRPIDRASCVAALAHRGGK